MAGNLYYHQGAYWYIHAAGDSELDCADRFLAETLAADAGLAAIIGDRIFQGTPPEDQGYPLVAYDFAAAEDDDATFAGEAARLIYLVQVIDQVDLGQGTGNVRDACKIIRGILQGATGTNTEGSILMVRRKQPWRMEETREAL